MVSRRSLSSLVMRRAWPRFVTASRQCVWCRSISTALARFNPNDPRRLQCEARTRQRQRPPSCAGRCLAGRQMLTASGQQHPVSGPVSGWARLSDVAAWIDTWAAPLGLEDAPVADAAGRVLAADVTAAMDLPPFDRATADGFALRADETVGAGAYNPLPFRLAPASAGVAPGHAVAVESGDPLPAGADTVARPEQAMPDAPGTIAIIAPVAVGAEVERVGSQCARGGVLFAAGQQLGPGDIGLLASTGVGRVPVVVRPRVRCLLAAGRPTEAGQSLAPGDVIRCERANAGRSHRARRRHRGRPAAH